jgi:hypothetical protein
VKNPNSLLHFATDLRQKSDTKAYVGEKKKTGKKCFMS